MEKTATGELPTRKVLSAVGGLFTLPEAMRAVQAHRYEGKVVLFPRLPDLPLCGLTELDDSVRVHLEAGRYWTRAAESALFEQRWKAGSSL